MLVTSLKNKILKKPTVEHRMLLPKTLMIYQFILESKLTAHC